MNIILSISGDQYVLPRTLSHAQLADLLCLLDGAKRARWESNYESGERRRTAYVMDDDPAEAAISFTKERILRKDQWRELLATVPALPGKDGAK